MPRVEFEPTTPMFERAKTVRALDRADAVIDEESLHHSLIPFQFRGLFTEHVTSPVLSL
jgi:hypothetical protein